MADARLAPHRFTVDDYYRMVQTGVLSEDDRVELIEGLVVEMAAIGPRQAEVVRRLARLFERALGDRVVVSVQSPVRMGDLSEPEPDVALLRPGRPYGQAHPTPDDVLLIVEVADSSLDSDRSNKVPLYGRFAVPETWLVDVDAGVIEVFRTPSATGYAERLRVGRDNDLAPLAFPDAAFVAAEILV